MANTQAPEVERTRLSKQAVVDRGLALADADGLDKLTIRRLAQDLGVTPMALYWHFRSKEDLLTGLADQLWGEIDVNVDPSKPWSEQLRGLMESLIAVLRAHPSASQLLMEVEKQREPTLRATEVTLEVLRGAGFDPRHATAIARNTLWTALMLRTSEAGSKPGMTGAELEEHLRQSQVRMAMLPADRYPRVVECAAELTSCDADFHYRFGIDLFIAGVEAVAATLT
jgi:TetR/AcrR family transcriptional regulator, tetracycline repressor protein